MEREAVFEIRIQRLDSSEKIYSFKSSKFILDEVKQYDWKDDLEKCIKDQGIEDGKYVVFAVRIATNEEETDRLLIKIVNGLLANPEVFDKI